MTKKATAKVEKAVEAGVPENTTVLEIRDTETKGGKTVSKKDAAGNTLYLQVGYYPSPTVESLLAELSNSDEAVTDYILSALKNGLSSLARNYYTSSYNSGKPVKFATMADMCAFKALIDDNKTASGGALKARRFVISGVIEYAVSLGKSVRVVAKIKAMLASNDALRASDEKHRDLLKATYLTGWLNSLPAVLNSDQQTAYDSIIDACAGFTDTDDGADDDF